MPPAWSQLPSMAGPQESAGPSGWRLRSRLQLSVETALKRSHLCPHHSSAVAQSSWPGLVVTQPSAPMHLGSLLPHCLHPPVQLPLPALPSTASESCSWSACPNSASFSLLCHVPCGSSFSPRGRHSRSFKKSYGWAGGTPRDLGFSGQQ